MRWADIVPLYDFRCGACGCIEEIKVGFEAAHPTECVACGGPLVRLFSPPGLHLTNERTDPRRASGREFLGSPDRFRDSMRAFERSTGLGLSGAEMDRAIDRLKDAT